MKKAVGWAPGSIDGRANYARSGGMADLRLASPLLRRLRLASAPPINDIWWKLPAALDPSAAIVSIWPISS
jgi:hypothetical protein